MIKLFKAFLVLLILLNFTILIYTSGIQIHTKQNIEDLSSITISKPYALVLGASVNSINMPSSVYIDRLNTAHYLHQSNLVEKVVISGYRAEDGFYNELLPAKSYLTSKGIPEEDIFLDFNGVDTFRSLANYKQDYPNQELYIVTQNYHLYRALFIASILNIDAIGVSSDLNPYQSIVFYIQREYLANLKVISDYLQYRL